MATSEARIKANRANSLKSTGPSMAGRLTSRRNGLKHGLSGSGVVLAEEDAALVERRRQEFLVDFAPKTSVGQFLVGHLAVRSVQMGRAAKQESAASAERSRNAPEAFDMARLAEAARLIDVLDEDPRVHILGLLGTPEGVEAMIVEWEELKGDLTRDGRVVWPALNAERAENLTGYRMDINRHSRIAVLSKAIHGDFHYLGDQEGGDLDEDDRKDWARAEMIALIDVKIAELETYHGTFDFESIAADRRESGDRALFDPSKEASLARRYQSEATRDFFKTMNEIRRVEEEAASRPEPVATPEPATDSAPLASSWVKAPAPRDPQPPLPRPPYLESISGFDISEIDADKLDWPDDEAD